MSKVNLLYRGLSARPIAFWVAAFCVILFSSDLFALQLRSTGRFTRTGVVRQISAGQITVLHDDGKRVVYRVQDQDESAMAMNGGSVIGSNPAEIDVTGSLPKDLVEPGMMVKFEAKLKRTGQSIKPIETFDVVNQKTEMQVDPMESLDDHTELMFSIIGRVIRSTGAGFLLEVPKSRFARGGRMEIKIAESGTMEFEMNNLNRVIPGDTVEMMSGVTYSNGDNVIKTISIRMTAPRKKIATVASWHDQLVQKYGYLSDEPLTEPREVKSKHFILHTDVSEQNAKVLIAKLECMYGLISRYFGKRPKEAIECYVVNDLTTWGTNEIHGVGMEAIRNGGGVTVSGASRPLRSVAGNNSNYNYRNQRPVTTTYGAAQVYSCANHNTVQHEAVHAYCKMAFGTTGPTWYSEGMAEMGNYWRPRDTSVNIDPVVIEFLTSSPRKSMTEIVNEEQITGDSWQAYAWRWALCHLLVNNKNYSARFKKLGVRLMLEEEVDSFYDAFGDVENELGFEFDQFMKNLSNGYHVSLCKWDWKIKAAELNSEDVVKATVMARKGWQASRAKLVEGMEYDVAAKGEWLLEPGGEAITADGLNGEGKLIGTIMNNYKLSEPFEISAKGSFVAPSDGQLYMRCDDRWNELADNSGLMKIYLRISKNR